MAENRLRDEGEWWRLTAGSAYVSHLRVDFAFTIVLLAEDGPYECRIEQPFRLSLDGEIFAIDPQRLRSVSPALLLHMRNLLDALLYKNGSLRLELDRCIVEVPPNDIYESWQIRGPNGMLVVSNPGGGLTIWDRVDSS